MIDPSLKPIRDAQLSFMLDLSDRMYMLIYGLLKKNKSHTAFFYTPLFKEHNELMKNLEKLDFMQDFKRITDDLDAFKKRRLR